VVGAAGEDVCGVRVEADAVDVLIVADEDALLSDVISHPETGGLIVAARYKVMPKWTPLEIPDGLVMAFVYDHALPEVEGPESNGFVCGGGKEPAGVCGSDGAVGAGS
jgi:hypothetical protein